MKKQKLVLLILLNITLYYTALGKMSFKEGEKLPLKAQHFVITDYGAVGDGKTICTEFINHAIEACHQNGGGIVYFPAGAYVSGTIFLKDNIHLYLEAGAILICSTDVNQFPYQTSTMVSLVGGGHSLIHAENKKNITISGAGTIDGQGDKSPYHITHKERSAGIMRPRIISMTGCKNVHIKDITLKNSPSWMQHYLACEDLSIDGITVSNRRSSVNNDGIDIDCCRNVRISNCNINSEDDAIVMKSTSGKFCENITISNCVLSSHCNALKCGTESNGGFRNISVSNCVIYDTYLSGIALEIVDGGIMDLVNINNITMYRVNNPLFIKLGNRARPYSKTMEKPGMGEIHNIQITNIQANEVGEYIEEPEMKFSHYNARPLAAGIFIDGLPEKNISNIALSNFVINYKGGGSKEDALVKVPDNPQAYPEYSSYGDIRPAYGFYCRNITHLRLENIQVSFDKPDYRPAYIFDHVDQLYINHIEGEKSVGKHPVVKLVQCSDAFIKMNPFSMKKKDIIMDKKSELIINYEQ